MWHTLVNWFKSSPPPVFKGAFLICVTALPNSGITVLKEVTFLSQMGVDSLAVSDWLTNDGITSGGEVA